ncbi:tubulin epsilon and delta complex protein 1 isoform X4 [Pogona vitticeps]
MLGTGDRRPGASSLPAAIGALSLSLPGPRVPPEIFRLAKFGRPQASVTFWKLLYILLKQIHGEGWMESPDIGAQVTFVKSVALNYGYRRLEFYQLPHDGSLGSGELLLAFSWFLCRISLMEQLLTLNRLKLWDETIVCTCDGLLNSLQKRKDIALESDLKSRRDIRYLQWLNGRLQFQWRSCHTEQQEQCKLLHKLLQCIESESSRLESFLKWKTMEHVYWQWMETILDPERDDVEPHDKHIKNTHFPSGNLCYCGISRTIEELDRCTQELLILCNELHELATYKKIRKEELEQLGERDFCKSLKEAQTSLDLKLSNLKCHDSAHRINKTHGPYRLIFKDKFCKANKTKSVRSAESTKLINEKITAADLINDLKKQEARLKMELKRRQDEDRKKIHEAAKTLLQVLFIPPMRRQNTRVTE